MGFLQLLRSNREGIQLRIPGDIEIIDESEGRLLFRKPGEPVLWEISRSIFDLDLRANYHKILMSEIACFAREEFEQQYYQRRRDSPPENELFDRPPRTSDPDWSPIIDANLVQIGSAPALYILRRLSYQPGWEFISSHLMIPTARATYEINMHCAADMTGYRESALYIVLMEQHKGADPEALTASLNQHFYDDPAKDEMFPEHPLSQLRSAYRWLLDRQGANLNVTSPLPDYPDGEIRLDQIGCAFALPPGYTFCRPISEAMGHNIAVFVRVIMPLSSISDGKKMLSVWRPDKRIVSNDGRAELQRFAISSTQDWDREGAGDIQIETEMLPDLNGRPQLACLVNFTVQGVPCRTLARWFIDGEGYIFRVDVGGPPVLSKEYLNEDLETVINTWRRLPISDEPPAEKPWWQFWK